MLGILVQTRNASSGIKAATPDLLKRKQNCTRTHAHTDRACKYTRNQLQLHGKKHIVAIQRLACYSEGYLTRKGENHTNIKNWEYSFCNIRKENRKSFGNYIVLANSDFWVTKQKVKANFPKYCKIYCISIAAFRMTYNCHYRLLLHNKRLQQIFVNWHQSTYSY